MLTREEHQTIHFRIDDYVRVTRVLIFNLFPCLADETRLYIHLLKVCFYFQFKAKINYFAVQNIRIIEVFKTWNESFSQTLT